MDIAVVGGTGAEGFGLTLRLADAGHHVTIGSRDATRGAEAAARAVETLGGGEIDGTCNEESVPGKQLVMVTVPFAGQAEIYRSLKGRVDDGAVVMDATSPLATAVGGKAWQVVRPWHGSAAEQAAAILGPGPRLVAGFHTIAAKALTDLAAPIESDVMLCGDDADAKSLIGGVIDQIPGMRWIDCGALSMARITETLTALLISINRQYKVKESGFRIEGREAWGRP
ncbi:MAG: NADPH-dependent F420 reductase [Actinomycetota bacterium]